MEYALKDRLLRVFVEKTDDAGLFPGKLVFSEDL
jgi:hypothetical protein